MCVVQCYLYLRENRLAITSGILRAQGFFPFWKQKRRDILTTFDLSASIKARD